MKHIMLLTAAAVTLSLSADSYEVSVASGETQSFSEAVTAKGVPFETGMRLVKGGDGTLTTDTSLASSMNGLTIEDGTVSTVLNDQTTHCFGTGDVKVREGGTLLFDNNDAGVGTRALASRWCYLAGTGVNGRGALVATKNAQTLAMQFALDADALVSAEHTSWESFIFIESTVWFYGHTLTLKSGSNTIGHRISNGNSFSVTGTGRLVLDGAAFKTGATSTLDRKSGGGTAAVTLELKNSATFLPGAQNAFALFDAIESSSDSTVKASDASITIDASIDGWTGAPTVDGSITSLAVGKKFGIRTSDLADGKALTMAGPISFGENCALAIEGSLDDIPVDEAGHVIIAASDAGVTGLPVLAASDATRYWSVEAGADGKTVELVYTDPAPAGSINVARRWGIKTGADAAAGNAARFNSALASCTVENPVLFFPAGDYYFDATLETGLKAGVTICGEGDASVLHGTSGMTAVLSAVNTPDLTVRNVDFADCAGVAIVASGTENLTVADVSVTRIGGAISGTDETAIVSVTGGTETFVRLGCVLDGATYSARVRLDGGTAKDGGEPFADGVAVYVPAGVSQTLAAAFANSGLADYPANARLHKTGAGTLVGDATYKTAMKGVTVEEGTYSVASNEHLGIGGAELSVKAGGTLYVTSAGNTVLLSRVLRVCGDGAADRSGALVVAHEPARADYCFSALSIVLDDDATFYCENDATGLAYVFRNAKLNCGGHVLTLRSAAATSGFQANGTFETLTGTSGTVVADGCVLSLPASGNARGASAEVTVGLLNGATFQAGGANSFAPFVGFTSDSSGKVTGSATGIAAALDTWTGCGTLDENIASLTISKSISIRADELTAGQCLTAVGNVAFGAGAKVLIDDATKLDAAAASRTDPGFMFVTAASVTGRPTREGDFNHWAVKAVAGGLALVKGGLLLLFR